MRLSNASQSRAVFFWRSVLALRLRVIARVPRSHTSVHVSFSFVFLFPRADWHLQTLSLAAGSSPDSFPPVSQVFLPLDLLMVSANPRFLLFSPALFRLLCRSKVHLVLVLPSQRIDFPCHGINLVHLVIKGKCKNLEEQGGTILALLLKRQPNDS